MLLLPLLAFPFLLAVAVYRLYEVPKRYLAGTLHLAKPKCSAVTLATVLAYSLLLTYTLVLVALVVQIFVMSQPSLSAWLAAAPVFAGYPIAYIGAEWVFYYGFRRPSREPS